MIPVQSAVPMSAILWILHKQNLEREKKKKILFFKKKDF